MLFDHNPGFDSKRMLDLFMAVYLDISVRPKKDNWNSIANLVLLPYLIHLTIVLAETIDAGNELSIQLRDSIPKAACTAMAVGESMLWGTLRIVDNVIWSGVYVELSVSSIINCGSPMIFGLRSKAVSGSSYQQLLAAAHVKQASDEFSV